MKRSTRTVEPWKFQRIQWGPFVAVRRRTVESRAYEEHEGPWDYYSLVMRIGYWRWEISYEASQVRTRL